MTSIALPDERATLDLGGRVGARCAGLAEEDALALWLCGPLGAGKTTFARGVLAELGVRGPVRSPTFTIIEQYECGPLEVVHIDLYRLEQPTDAAGLGLREYDRPAVLWLIEWPERAPQFVRKADLVVRLTQQGDHGREALLEARSARGRQVLNWVDTDDSYEGE